MSHSAACNEELHVGAGLKLQPAADPVAEAAWVCRRENQGVPLDLLSGNKNDTPSKEGFYMLLGECAQETCKGKS